MSRKWTREQALAICDNKGTLLLSAAAGSGKTAVLVERVVLLAVKKRAVRYGLTAAYCDLYQRSGT